MLAPFTPLSFCSPSFVFWDAVMLGDPSAGVPQSSGKWVNTLLYVQQSFGTREEGD
jgi:hypothetical protein